MAQHKISSITELMERTNLSRNALNKLWHDEDLDTVKVGTLMKICDAFQISLSELLDYTPKKKSE